MKALLRLFSLSPSHGQSIGIRLTVIMLSVLVLFLPAARAQVTAVSLQSPALSDTGKTSLLSPIHVLATAEDTSPITGYVVYVDNHDVYSNSNSSADAWISIPAGAHSLSVKALDANSSLATSTYQIDVTGFTAPAAPSNAHRIVNIDSQGWTVDNAPGVGGNCNNGSLGDFSSTSDPNTENVPASGQGQHFILTSTCQYDDSLFYRKYSSTSFASDTNFLWDFWFYIPKTTQSNTVQALEFDLFHAVPLSDGVHEFMFGSQCNYVTNQWEFWLPVTSSQLSWLPPGNLPCRFTPGQWHHATYFLQRVSPSGYQVIPKAFTPSTDANISLRFGTVTIDGKSVYVGGVSWSTIPIPQWSPVLGVQHQLDSAAAGAVIDEYADRESLTSW
ncbi:MAG: hypothetical protein WBS24_11545 [Terriglobales bacterium]